MSVLKRDTKYHTYSDYLDWSRTHGDELIDGTAYVREPPSPQPSHQLIAGEIFGQIRDAIKKRKWRVFTAPLDVRLPKSTEADEQVDTVVQPDVFIMRDRKKIDARGIRGAPDWLAEILSPSTARYDERIKIPVYERAGVPEVWLVNSKTRTVSIYCLSDGRYAKPTIRSLRGKTRLTAVPGVTINWDAVVPLISY